MPSNSFSVIGLGTRKYQQDNEPVKTCQEMLLPGCDCCRIGPCKLCLTWTVDEVEHHGTAIGNGEEWVGTVDGIAFRAYWLEYDCSINVELDGEHQWTGYLCDGYEGDAITCRDWGSSTEYEKYGGEVGILEWKVTEYLPLIRTKGSLDQYAESACASPFCGDCECTCEELCVRITGGECTCTGSIPFTGERCEDGRVTFAEWQGDIECNPGGTSVHVLVRMSRSDYDGSCQLSGKTDGDVCEVPVDILMADTPVLDCKLLNASWSTEIDDETYTITVNCLECDVCEDGCCSSLPDVLHCTFIGNGCTCIDGVTVQLDRVSNGNGWEYNGDPTTCFPPNDTVLQFNVECQAGDGCNAWILNVVYAQGCHPSPQTYPIIRECSCDPLVLEWDVPFRGLGGCCQGGIVDTDVRFIVTL